MQACPLPRSNDWKNKVNPERGEMSMCDVCVWWGKWVGGGREGERGSEALDAFFFPKAGSAYAFFHYGLLEAANFPLAPKWTWIGFVTLVTEESWRALVPILAINDLHSFRHPWRRSQVSCASHTGEMFLRPERPKGKMAPTFLTWVVMCSFYKGGNLDTLKGPKYWMARDSNLEKQWIFMMFYKTIVIRILCKSITINRH